MGKQRMIVVEPYLPSDEARVFDAFPDVLFVGTALARHPEILPLLIEQDRDRLVQVQE